MAPPERFPLDGRTALVTGASRGIGAAVARALDHAGARVALTARDRPALDAVAAEVDAELIDRLYAVNVRAPLLLTAALIPSLGEHGHGSVVNLSSVSGVVGTPKRSAYAATKGAIDAMTRSLAVELGPLGIRVNSVAPGVVDTDLGARNKTVPGVVERIEEMTPLRRWAQPDDIADVVVLLASDAARFVTGETLCADGGMARTLDLFGGAV